MYTEPPKSEKALMENASLLAGKTIQELSCLYKEKIPSDIKYAKGWVGQFLERILGASSGSNPQPDFEYINVELKTIPIDDRGRPLESTYVCIVSLCGLTHETWYNSLVKKKLSRVLWLPIESGNHAELYKRRVGQAILWSPSYEEEYALKNDWEELTDLINMGQLEEINATFGKYLQIRPKALNSRALCWGLDALGMKKLTLPRGFYLRRLFTAQVLKEYYN